MARFRAALVCTLLTALVAGATGPCLAMALAQGEDACTMPHADRGHCAPDVALGPTCCHAATAPVPADAPAAPLANAPMTLALLWSSLQAPAAPPVLARHAASRHALVLGSPPLFLQHRVLLI